MFGKQFPRRYVIAGVATLSVAGAALVPAIALAQANPPALIDRESVAARIATLTESGALALHLGERGGPAFGGKFLRGEAAEEIATSLGVTVEALQEAFAAAKPERPAERPVAPLTEEERAEKRAAMQATVAAALGVTPEALEAAIEAAQPTEEEIAAKRAEARAALETRLAEQVGAGRITQERADAMLERFDSGEGHGFHGPRGFGGPRGFDGPRGLGGAAPAGISF